MEIALEHKFTQHPALREELLATGDAELVEVRRAKQMIVRVLIQGTGLCPGRLLGRWAQREGSQRARESPHEAENEVAPAEVLNAGCVLLYLGGLEN